MAVPPTWGRFDLLDDDVFDQQLRRVNSGIGKGMVAPPRDNSDRVPRSWGTTITDSLAIKKWDNILALAARHGNFTDVYFNHPPPEPTHDSTGAVLTPAHWQAPEHAADRVVRLYRRQLQLVDVQNVAFFTAIDTFTAGDANDDLQAHPSAAAADGRACYVALTVQGAGTETLALRLDKMRANVEKFLALRYTGNYIELRKQIRLLNSGFGRFGCTLTPRDVVDRVLILTPPVSNLAIAKSTLETQANARLSAWMMLNPDRELLDRFAPTIDLTDMWATLITAEGRCSASELTPAVASFNAEVSARAAAAGIKPPANKRQPRRRVCDDLVNGKKCTKAGCELDHDPEAVKRVQKSIERRKQRGRGTDKGADEANSDKTVNKTTAKTTAQAPNGPVLGKSTVVFAKSATVAPHNTCDHVDQQLFATAADNYADHYNIPIEQVTIHHLTAQSCGISGWAQPSIGGTCNHQPRDFVPENTRGYEFWAVLGLEPYSTAMSQAVIRKHCLAPTIGRVDFDWGTDESDESYVFSDDDGAVIITSPNDPYYSPGDDDDGDGSDDDDDDFYYPSSDDDDTDDDMPS